MPERADRLGAFLKSQMGDSSPWNCSTMPADWCVSLGHPDFAAAWRGVVGIGECEVGQLVERWCDGIGDALPQVKEPQAGDIAVIAAHGLEAGAIFTGERWATRLNRGVLFASVDSVTPLRIWRP